MFGLTHCSLSNVMQGESAPAPTVCPCTICTVSLTRVTCSGNWKNLTSWSSIGGSNHFSEILLCYHHSPRFVLFAWPEASQGQRKIGRNINICFTLPSRNYKMLLFIIKYQDFWKAFLFDLFSLWLILLWGDIFAINFTNAHNLELGKMFVCVARKGCTLVTGCVPLKKLLLHKSQKMFKMHWAN